MLLRRSEEPWLSVPAFRPVWFYRRFSCFLYTPGRRQSLLLDASSTGRRNIANDLRGLGAKSHANFAADAKPTFSTALGVKRPVIRSMNVELFAAGRTVTWVDSHSPTSLT